jgi:hypothetical protein
MNARARAARATIRTRTRIQRAQSRIVRRGTASLTTHAIAAGLAPTEARAVAGSLRKAANRLGVEGASYRTHAGRRMRTATGYTPAQVVAIAAAYRPRKPAYLAAKTRLALAA